LIFPVGEQDDDSTQDEKERNSVPSEIEDIQKNRPHPKSRILAEIIGRMQQHYPYRGDTPSRLKRPQFHGQRVSPNLRALMANAFAL
jgi:hypothetical protein